MDEREHEARSDELEKEADALQRHSDELEREVEETRQDWERKRADASIPGAPPRAESEDDGGPDDAA